MMKCKKKGEKERICRRLFFPGSGTYAQCDAPGELLLFYVSKFHVIFPVSDGKGNDIAVFQIDDVELLIFFIHDYVAGKHSP